MKIYYYIILQLILLACKINCQVVLTRALLQQWYDGSLTSLSDLNLSYSIHIHKSIDPKTVKLKING